MPHVISSKQLLLIYHIISYSDLHNFRWAWHNPHLTLHISPESRVTKATKQNSKGRWIRPAEANTLKHLMWNLHLLLRAPSLSRWPLELRFFAPDLHQAWLRFSADFDEQPRSSLPIILDSPPTPLSENSTDNAQSANAAQTPDLVVSEQISKTQVPTLRGIAALNVDYASQKQYVEKAHSIIEFEQENSCTICSETLDHDHGIYTICPHQDCESVTHIKCLGEHYIKNEMMGKDGREEVVVPIQGPCPSCEAVTKWVDVVKEVSLRMRGEKLVEKLLKKPRTKKVKNTTSAKSSKEAGMAIDATATVPGSSDIEEEENEEDEEDQDDFLEFDDLNVGDDYGEMEEQEDDVRLPRNRADQQDHMAVGMNTATNIHSQRLGSGIVIPDSDWDDAEILE